MIERGLRLSGSFGMSFCHEFLEAEKGKISGE